MVFRRSQYLSNYFQHIFEWHILFLDGVTVRFVQWFDFNYTNINSGKRLLLLSGKENVVSANIDNNTIISENKNELLGILLDSKLSFEVRINNLWKKIEGR